MSTAWIIRHGGGLMCATLLGGLLSVATGQELPLPRIPAIAVENTDELRARLDSLEKHQAELLKKIQEAKENVSLPGHPNGDGAGLQKDQVTTIVEQYLRSQEAKKKADDDAKKNNFVEVGKDLDIKARWRNGVWFETANKDFAFHAGGRIQYDMGWFDQSKNMPNFADGAGLRRARLRAEGTAWEVFTFVTELDFANPDGTAAAATFTDAYLEVTQLPLIGSFRAGQFKEPYTLEELISDNDITFMERSLANQAFSPARHLGLLVQRPYLEERATIATGFFRTNSTGNRGFDSGDGEYSSTTRATFLPLYADNGRRLIHIGGDYSHRSFNNTDGPNPSFSSRTSVRLGTPLLLSTADTGLFKTANSVDLWAAELAGVWGPLSVQAEVLAAQVENSAAFGPKPGTLAPNPLYWGGYVQVSYFLTGENRPYNKKTGVFERVVPHENFFLVKTEQDNRPLFGRGAWELTARGDYLDLRSDGYINPANAGTKVGGTGVLQDIVLGVNWYWNPNAKFQVNYVRAWRDGDGRNTSGTVDALAIRFSVNF